MYERKNIHNCDVAIYIKGFLHMYMNSDTSMIAGFTYEDAY